VTNRHTFQMLAAISLTALVSQPNSAWGASTYAQPYIQSFSPTSGAVGTTINITGSGFTGANAAWVGTGHDATVKVVSDTQMQVVVPADGKTGQVAVLNSQNSAFTPTSFTVSGTSGSSQQLVISGFSPASGAVGTVITVNGSGLSGATAAWVGNGHDAKIKVISSTQVQVTVPADATSGTISILKSKSSVTSTGTFTVTSTPTYPQQVIGSFSPTTGIVGTVITVTGSGFTGSTSAWVGSGHDASLTVVTDTQANVTVPADASSGAITLVNPAHTASSGGSFTLTTTTPPPPPVSGLSIRTSGKNLVNANGAVVQLRGINYSGFEFAAIQGWSGNDPSGAQAGQAGGPNWPAVQNWKANAVRIPLNEASWLGYSCTDSSGVTHNPDPAGNYKSAVQTQVTQANAAGLYAIIDLHWTAPGTTCPMLQTQMADADHSLAFWTSVANTFKNNPAVLFELFNEPFLNFDFTGDPWAYMMKGTGGSFSGYPATSSSGNWVNVTKTWTVASYQDMINTVRATGATNVVIVGTMQYAQDLSGWLANKPTDPLNQMVAAWHPYRLYNSAWDYPYPNYYPQVFTDAQNILAAGIPIIMTEIGGQNTAGTPSCPICTTMTGFADTYGASVIGWAWDVWGDPENVLIKDVNGTPTDGYGVTYRNWTVNHQ
jgi:endoglucanase